MAPSLLRALAVLRTALLVLAASAAVAVAADRVRKGTPKGQPAPAGFKIFAKVPGPLVPGVTQPVLLTLRNPHRWPLKVSRLSVELVVDKAHTKAGCDRDVHYRQVALPAMAYPLRLPPLSTRTLRQLGVRAVPQIRMLDLPVNQDACQGAKLRLRLAGRSARAGSARAR